MTELSACLPVVGRQVSYLVLGGALLLPFGVLGTMITALAPGTRGQFTDGLFVALVTLLAVPAFGLLAPVQSLEQTAARELLAAPAPSPGLRLGPARRRVAGWFTLHVLLGAVGSCLLIAVALVPVVLVEDIRAGRLGTAAGAGLLLATLLLAPAATVLLGHGLARLAPRALGPSPTEQLALLQSEAGELTRRARLAREVHDSVGHALSVVTLQAAAARHVFDRDPEFTRSALAAVEDTARAALDELDHVLGLIAEDGDRPAPAGRPPGLAELAGLLARTRMTGVPVLADLDRPDALAAVPAGVSRQAYRITQEAVTNAVRHGQGAPVHVRVRAEGTLAIAVTNAIPLVPQAVPGGGRGLAGLHRRVQALGGSVQAGPDGDTWRLAVRLPLEEQ